MNQPAQVNPCNPPETPRITRQTNPSSCVPRLHITKNKMKKGRKLALWGAWLQLGPVFGVLGTVIGMIGAFGQMSEFDQNNQGSAEALAKNVSLALNTTAIGIIAGLIGLVLLLVALFSSKYRAPWFFWFMAIYSGLCLLAFPVGTVIGIVVLVHIIPRKEEFWCDPGGVVNSVATPPPLGDQPHRSAKELND